MKAHFRSWLLFGSASPRLMAYMGGVTMFGIGFWEIVILAVIVGLPFTVISVVLAVLLLIRRRVP